MKDKSKLSAETYDHISDAYAAEFNEPSDHIDEFLKLIPEGGRILDAGCGPGVDSVYMASLGLEVIGIDLSKKMLELARKKNPNIRFENVDIRGLNFGKESFDGILASYSLIHIPKKDIPNVIKNFLKILKPNGVICIGIQEGESKETFVTELFKPDEKTFVNVISADELRELLQKNGFAPINEFMRKAESKDELEFDFNKFVLIAKKEFAAKEKRNRPFRFRFLARRAERGCGGNSARRAR